MIISRGANAVLSSLLSEAGAKPVSAMVSLSIIRCTYAHRERRFLELMFRNTRHEKRV